MVNVNGRRAITRDTIKSYLKKYVIYTSEFEKIMEYNYSKEIYITLDEVVEDIERIFYNRYLQACERDPIKYYNVYQYVIDNLLKYNKIFIVQEYIKIAEETFAPRITLYYKKT